MSLITTGNCRLLLIMISLQLWTFRTINEIISFTVSSAFNFIIIYGFPRKRKIYHDTILIYLQIISQFSVICEWHLCCNFKTTIFTFYLSEGFVAVVLIYLVSPIVHAWGLVMLWCFFSFLVMSCRYWLFARSWTLPSIIFQLLSSFLVRPPNLVFYSQDGFCL